MTTRKAANIWGNMLARNLATMSRNSIRVGTRATQRVIKQIADKRLPPAGSGDWLAGMAIGAAGARRYWLYRPAGIKLSERLPLIVMLHGCAQDAKSFAISTRMNSIAARERFLVLYPEQDRLSNAQGCWNWFSTNGGRHLGEASLIMKAIDQVCLLYPVNREQIVVAGMSAGASMAALVVTRFPERFKALVMHSGVPPGTARTALSAPGAMRGRRATAALQTTPLAMAELWPPLTVIHGSLDRVVAASNGLAAAQLWANAAGARIIKSRAVQRGTRYPMTVTDFKCGQTTVSTFIEIAQLGHAWSGGSSKVPFGDAKGPDASRMVWAVAAKQLLAS